MRALAIAASMLAVSAAATAQGTEPSAEAPTHSRLDASLFYQLLVGEIELREGEPGTAYQVVLDAARKTKDEQLFRRATEIAVQARAGEQALAAAQQWRTDVPGSLDAHRYVVQILVALNRAPETADPLRSLLKITPEAERANVIMSLPRLYARVPQKEQIPGLLEQVLKPYADQPATRTAVGVALGRTWLIAADPSRALELARRTASRDTHAEAPALLALELLPGTRAAEAVVQEHLVANPKSHAVRLGYARVLTNAQRYGDAVAQLEALTRSDPTVAVAWLTLGALQLELRQPKQASEALERYVQLVQADPGTATAADPHDADEGQSPPAPERGLVQAWLMLAQAAEQQNDFKAAEDWLKKVDSPQRALEVLSRRASMMTRQGQLREARELIRRAPERSEEDSRAKLIAEVQVLREAKSWGEANKLLTSANQKYPDDVDLLYEQSMMAEKLNRMDEMERLLRRVIELKPDHHHAHNALGYSLADRNQRLPEAKALIQRALDIAPGEPFITDSLGWVEYRLGNHAEALRLLRGAYQSRPDPEIAAHLGEVLWVNGQRDEARRVWREARSRDSTNDVLRETLARLKVGDL
jgi:tetratricopeptide (TPR) repeat protein